IDRRRAVELEANGYATIYDLPTDLELSAVHARQVKAIQTGQMVVEPSLKGALAPFVSPLAYLDFETVSLAIPRWPGCRPWHQVCHPDFGGAFSIKRTLPALVPGLSYSDLKVQDGEVATVELQRLMLEGANTRAVERVALREDLLRYCERDTWAMVKLLETLR